jgi:hypothetical protein
MSPDDHLDKSSCDINEMSVPKRMSEERVSRNSGRPDSEGCEAERNGYRLSLRR